MMSAFVPRAIASTLAEPDPSKHVNYTLGMVLGVDDFKQEFAYLSGRDQWLARDLFGYGTVSGLQVNIEVEGSAPQVVVTPGVAVSPRGQSIRVSPAQCADLDTWLATNRDELTKRIGDVKVNAAETRLFVTLCFRECSTDMVPIPGEPCRSADETLAASRVTDDFKLELRFDPPTQREEDALREYADWLGQIEIKESSDTPKLQEFEDVIRKLVRDQSQSKAGASLMTGPPPADLKIESRHVAKYLRTALNFWVTELRPKVQSWRPEVGSGLDAKSADKGEECLLLAEVRVPLKRAAASAVWRAGEAKTIQVIEDRRPVVAHLRMIQELLLGVGRSTTQKPPAYQTMAAGLVKGAEGSGGNEFNNLRVTKTGAGFISMTFDGYEQPNPDTAPFQYIVKALLVLPSGSALTQTVVTFARFEAADTGFTLNVTNAGKAVEKAALANLSFMVEVSRYATAGKDNKETKEKDAKETKDTKESKEKDTKESKEKDTKETKEKDTKESKDTKDTKEKDTKESKEKDTKESKEKDTKETKEKDTKETKEKDTKETKEKDTKETKEKDTKETKEKDTKETKEKGKEKDTKESKEKDTKETKEKDTKETKEKEAAKDTKEAKEEKASQDKLKDGAALKEKEQLGGFGDPAPFSMNGGEKSSETVIATGHAFIRGDERPEVGRRALELADESEDTAKPEDVGKPVDAGKPGEALDKQAEAIN